MEKIPKDEENQQVRMWKLKGRNKFNKNEKCKQVRTILPRM